MSGMSTACRDSRGTLASFVAAVVVALVGSVGASNTKSELGHAVSKFHDWKPPARSFRRVSTSALTSTLEKALQRASGDEVGILAIENAMAHTYRALPKNSYGLLSRSAAGFMVHNYFAQVHRFFIKGIGFDHATEEEDKTLVRENSILQSEAPELVLALLEAGRGGRGLQLGDVAAMAATLHQMVLTSVVTMLWQTFGALHALNRLPEDGFLSLEDVAVLFQAWAWVTKFDASDHGKLDRRMESPTHVMMEFGKVATNLLLQRVYKQRDAANPFVQRGYQPLEMMSLAVTVVAEMGTWQDQDCKVMKKYLRQLDPETTGRVPLATIFEQPATKDENNMTVFRFAEPQDNLREAGSLDESDPERPQLLISNYLLGPPNCYRMSTYYTYCCLSECDSLMGEIERAVQAPEALPQQLVSLVGNLSSTSMDEPRPVSEMMKQKLLATAALHGGRVPLHGRLFAQWLHFAFPHECPYPHVTHKDASGSTLMTSFFQAAAAPQAAHASEKLSSETATVEEAAFLNRWSDDELLPFVDTPRPSGFEGKRRLLSLSFMAVTFLALLYHVRSAAMAGMKALGLHTTKIQVQAGSLGCKGVVDKWV